MSAARPETGATDANEGTTPEGENVVWAFFRNTFFRRIWPIPEMKKDEAECERFTNVLVAELRSSGFVIALAEHVVSAADREAIGLSLDVLDCIDRWRMTPVADRDADATLGIMADKLTPEHRERLIRLAATSARLERLGSGGEETT